MPNTPPTAPADTAGPLHPADPADADPADTTGSGDPAAGADGGLATDPAFAALLAGSHLRVVGTPLGAPHGAPEDVARRLYDDAPFGLLAHDTADDPRFVYANRTAQRCFEYGWARLVGLPSRLSAEPGGQDDRRRLLDDVERHGFATGYRGLRVAASGRRFWIEDVTMWNLVDEDGTRHGQAAVFRRWSDAGTPGEAATDTGPGAAASH